MPALYVMIPVALLLVGAALYLFFWAVDSGQYDDLDSPAHAILFDDQDAAHTAATSAGVPPTMAANRDDTQTSRAHA